MPKRDVEHRKTPSKEWAIILSCSFFDLFEEAFENSQNIPKLERGQGQSLQSPWQNSWCVAENNRQLRLNHLSQPYAVFNQPSFIFIYSLQIRLLVGQHPHAQWLQLLTINIHQPNLLQGYLILNLIGSNSASFCLHQILFCFSKFHHCCVKS